MLPAVALLVLLLFFPPGGARVGYNGEAQEQQADDQARSTRQGQSDSAIFIAQQFPAQQGHSNEETFFLAAGQEPIHLADQKEVKSFILTAGVDYFDLASYDDLQELTSKQDALGNHYYKFQQLYKGLEVFNRQLVVQTSPDQQFVMLSGQFHGGLDLASEAGLKGADALEIALSQLPESPLASPEIISPPQLLIHVGTGEAVLAYVAAVAYEVEPNLELPPLLAQEVGAGRDEKIFIDAHTGRLLELIANN